MIIIIISPRKSQVKVRGTYISPKISFFSIFPIGGKVYHCLSTIQQSCPAVRWLLYQRGKRNTRSAVVGRPSQSGGVSPAAKQQFQVHERVRKGGMSRNTQLDEVQTRQAGFPGALTFHLCLLISMLD